MILTIFSGKFLLIHWPIFLFFLTAILLDKKHANRNFKQSSMEILPIFLFGVLNLSFWVGGCMVQRYKILVLGFPFLCSHEFILIFCSSKMLLRPHSFIRTLYLLQCYLKTLIDIKRLILLLYMFFFTCFLVFAFVLLSFLLWRCIHQSVELNDTIVYSSSQFFV